MKRSYLVKQGRAAIRATEAAFALIDAVPKALADPGTTALWEQALELIEAGQLTLEAFTEKQAAWVAQLVQQYRGARLPLQVPKGPACPLCGAATLPRLRPHGPFWSCGRYPECQGTVAVASPSPGGRRAGTRAPARPQRGAYETS